MVIETFRAKCAELVGERFREKGRILPEGVIYLDSWMTEDGTRCYQLMEAPDRAALEPWLAAWSDLVDFEVTPVIQSTDYWSNR